jgi:lysophospholipase L1-like esterase
MNFRNVAISFVLIFILAGSVVAGSALAEPVLRDGDVLAICGDSITEQRQYSVFIETYLLAAKPVKDLRIVQIGWSGERAPGFLARVDSDVLPFHPTVATTFYGMNDGGYGSMSPAIGQTFETALKSSIDALKSGGVRAVVVGSPGAVDTATFNRPGVNATVYNQTLAALTDISRSVARQTDSPFTDVHGLMMEVMAKAKAKYGDKFAFAGPDGIHPGAAGHLAIAYAFLKGLGCDGDLGTITLDLTSGHNEATGGHRIISAQNGSVEIESSRIPFCFLGDGASANSERSIVDFLPFNQQLNRLTLKVNNAGKGRVRVTWGSQAKEFSSDDLAAGINLAAEFPDGPLVEPFTRIEKAVRAQQDYETPLIKILMHSIPVDKKIIPEDATELDKVVADAMAHDKTLFDASAAEAAKPVHHTIKIEPVP